MEMMLWNIVLTLVVGVMGFLLKAKFDEVTRLGILLNQTREQMAREHVTRKEVEDRIDKVVVHIDQRFNRLETKLDDLRNQKGI